MNLLLDTNVLIDYLGRKSPFFEDAQKVFMAAYFGDVRLWVPAQSFVDAFFVLKKYMNASHLNSIILEVFGQTNIVDLTGTDLIRAAQLSWTDMEDCLIALAADKANADYLITRDSAGFDRSMVPPLSPSAWVDLMEREHGLVYEIDGI